MVNFVPKFVAMATEVNKKNLNDIIGKPGPENMWVWCKQRVIIFKGDRVIPL